MPEWTLGQLKSNATARIGQRTDLSASDVSFWVNQAYADIVQRWPHALSERTAGFSVSSGDSLLQLPSDFLEVINISLVTQSRVGSLFTLEQSQLQILDALGYYPVGKPRRYAHFRDQIQLWPSADSSIASDGASSARSYVMRYRSRAEDMVSDTSVPSVDTEWRVPILFQAEAYLHELVGNEEEGAVSRARALREVQSLENTIGRRQSAKNRFAVSLPLRRSRRSSAAESRRNFFRTRVSE